MWLSLCSYVFWLFVACVSLLRVPAVHGVAFHGVPCQSVLRCSEPRHVVCEVVVFVANIWLLVKIDAVFQIWADRPRFQHPFWLVDLAELDFAMSLCPAVVVVFSNSGLFPVFLALREDPWFDPVCCHQVHRFVSCAYCAVNWKALPLCFCFVVL